MQKTSPNLLSMMMMMITYTASVGLAFIIKKQLYKLVNKLLTLIWLRLHHSLPWAMLSCFFTIASRRKSIICSALFLRMSLKRTLLLLSMMFSRELYPRSGHQHVLAPEDLGYSAQDYGWRDPSKSWTPELWSLSWRELMGGSDGVSVISALIIS